MVSSRVHAVQQCLLLIAALFSIRPGESRLTVKPRNTVALTGDRVKLRCATDRQGDKNSNPIRWTFVTENPTCRRRHDHCDLVIENVRSSDAGGYDCTDGQSKIAQASLIVIDAFPVCGADVIPVVAGTNNNVTCRLNYTRFTDLSPGATMTSSVTWPYGESGYFRSVSADPHRAGTLKATVLDVQVTTEGIAPINWTAQFFFDAQSTFKDFASNNDTWSWTSRVIPVSGCPTSVFITSASGAYKPGSVLTCSSNGHPQPAYTWTDASGAVVAAGRNVTLEDGQFRLTCTATGQLNEQCSASLTVDNLPAKDAASSSNELLMMVLVIALGGLLCLTLVIIIVLAAFVHVLRTRTSQKPAPAVSTAEQREDNSYAGLQGYQPPEPTSSVYTPMNHVEPVSLPRQQDGSRRRGVETGYAGLNGAPRVPPRPGPDPSDAYITIIG